MAIISKTVTVFRCNVCAYEWQRRRKKARGKPRICPECKNHRWNDPELVRIPALERIKQSNQASA